MYQTFSADFNSHTNLLSDVFCVSSFLLVTETISVRVSLQKMVGVISEKWCIQGTALILEPC